MDKLSILQQFEQMLKERFPNRKNPLNKDLPSINTEKIDDLQFDKWRKNK